MKILNNWSHVGELQMASCCELQDVADAIKQILEERDYTGRFVLFRQGTVGLKLYNYDTREEWDLVADGFQAFVTTSDINAAIIHHNINYLHDLSWINACQFLCDTL